jgi:hypothetical protein
VSGAPVNCNDSNPCTNDSCAPLLGCQHKPVANGVSCDSPCNPGGLCTGGFCISTSNICDDGNPCTTDTCQTVKGNAQCHHAPVQNFLPCPPKGHVCFNGFCQ